MEGGKPRLRFFLGGDLHLAADSVYYNTRGASRDIGGSWIRCIVVTLESSCDPPLDPSCPVSHIALNIWLVLNSGTWILANTNCGFDSLAHFSSILHVLWKARSDTWRRGAAPGPADLLAWVLLDLIGGLRCERARSQRRNPTCSHLSPPTASVCSFFLFLSLLSFYSPRCLRSPIAVIFIMHLPAGPLL